MQTLIIGGGLCGLSIAQMLEVRGHDYLLVEARDRFGGRIKTEHFGGGAFDIGPAWYWPGQPRIASLIERLGLGHFEQHASGAQSFEDAQGHVQRHQGFAAMEGSLRVVGGLAAITDALAKQVPDARKRLGATVRGLTQTDQGIAATLASGETLTAKRVVLALPPRLALNIGFEPTLPVAATNAMQNIPTWMAGQAKAVAVYQTPFWRDAGLSGDAISRAGPMVEIHDASPHKGGPYALFGFIGVPPQGRQDKATLRQQLLAQFERLFGRQAAQPSQLFLKDWAYDAHTATPDDHAALYAHPTYGLPPAMAGLWGQSLHFSGTEVAPQFGGYIEGALEAAETTLRKLEGTGHG